MKSTKQLVLAAGGAVIVVVFAWYQFVWSHQTASIAKADKAMAKSVATAKSLKVRYSQLEAAKSEQPSRSSLLEQIDAAIPADPKLVEYMRLINAVADKNDVKLSASSHSEPVAPVAPAPASATTAGSTATTVAGAGTASAATPAAAPDAGLSKTSLTLTVNGTYDHVLAFVHALDTQARLIVVDSLSLSGGATAGATASDGASNPSSGTTLSPAGAPLTASITAHILSTGGVDALPQGATS